MKQLQWESLFLDALWYIFIYIYVHIDCFQLTLWRRNKIKHKELSITQVKVYCNIFRKYFSMEWYFYCMSPVQFLFVLLLFNCSLWAVTWWKWSLGGGRVRPDSSWELNTVFWTVRYLPLCSWLLFFVCFSSSLGEHDECLKPEP